MMHDEPIIPDKFLSIPNATVDKIKALHDAHIKARTYINKEAKDGNN